MVRIMPRSLNENDMDTPEAQWASIRWMGASKQAFNGKRGQAFLIELESANNFLLVETFFK